MGRVRFSDVVKRVNVFVWLCFSFVYNQHLHFVYIIFCLMMIHSFESNSFVSIAFGLIGNIMGTLPISMMTRTFEEKYIGRSERVSNSSHKSARSTRSTQPKPIEMKTISSTRSNQSNQSNTNTPLQNENEESNSTSYDYYSD